MATYQDLEFDWSTLCQECTECWTASDLQLAAELGKTLLERNKELETTLKQYQVAIEDKYQEIEYLTKQTAALREVNDSRFKIYEQLEISIQDLERANQRLSLENSSDKKHIKNLCMTIDSLESKCEELQRALDDMTLKQNAQLLKKQRTKSSSIDNGTSTDSSTKEENGTEQHGDEGVDMKENAEDEEVIRLLEQLQELRSLRAKDQRKATELEEQMAGLLQENMSLEDQLTMLRQKEEDMKTLQEEISTLEEVRQGQLCGRCLRNVDSRGHDQLSLMLDHEEEEDASVVNSIISETHRSTIMLHIEDPQDVQTHDNPYRVLVEKYEALLEMQRHPASARQQHVAPSTNCLSLQEELQLSGDFNSFNGKEDADTESDNDITETTPSNSTKIEANVQKKAEKAFSATPTDFSEAETSSSGFSDEISNKATQTEGHLLPPGSFLCSIADGDDCRFSIYDDASPIESRFRKTPEYRQLFREIFAVLKRAAEAKDEGEQLPLLEDLTPVAEAPRVPPATPAKEELPEDFAKHKANKSKSSESAKLTKSNVVGELKNTNNNAKAEENATASDQKNLMPEDESKDPVTKENENPKPKPAPKRDILEYLSAGVGAKKKPHGRKNSPMKGMKTTVAERVEQIESNPSCSNYPSRSGSGRRRREFRNSDRYRGAYTPSPNRGESPSPAEFWNKGENQTTTNGQQRASYSRQSYQRVVQQPQSTWDFQPFVSSASQEVAKLKRLEKSYAEVLRLGPQKCTSRPLSTNNHRK